jgi:hypothetical protein
VALDTVSMMKFVRNVMSRIRLFRANIQKTPR